MKHTPTDPKRTTGNGRSLSRRVLLRFLGGLLGSLALNGCTHSQTDSSVSVSAESALPSLQASPSALAQSNALTPRQSLPPAIATLFQNQTNPDIVFTQLMPAIVDALQCDRCFLFIRDPERQQTQITHGYSRDNRWPTMVQSGWNHDSGNLAAKDPLTASAYRSPEIHFIEDIETASPDVLDLNLERAVFGHRALAHTPIYHDGEFYGVLEPCVFDQPRVWTEGDRTLIHELQRQLGPLVVQYLQQVRT